MWKALHMVNRNFRPLTDWERIGDIYWWVLKEKVPPDTLFISKVRGAVVQFPRPMCGYTGLQEHIDGLQYKKMESDISW